MFKQMRKAILRNELKYYLLALALRIAVVGLAGAVIFNLECYLLDFLMLPYGQYPTIF